MAYLGMAMVVGIAALNTGNNLLFIILQAMLAAIVVSGVASAAVPRWLDLDIMVPSNAFAAKPVGVRVELHNPRLMVPHFALRCTLRWAIRKIRRDGNGKKRNLFFPVAPKGSACRITRCEENLHHRASQSVDPSGVLHLYRARVPGQRKWMTLPRRGMYSQDSLSVATRFPFSFLIRAVK